MNDVQKNYEAIPAYEMIKQYVVQKLIQLSEMSSEVQKFMYMKKRDRQAVSIFKSEVLSFYQFLRPKIMDFSIKSKDYKEFIEKMDFFIYNPSKFSLINAIVTVNNLNQFCEEYGMTRVTVWSGYATKQTDIYKVNTNEQLQV